MPGTRPQKAAQMKGSLAMQCRFRLSTLASLVVDTDRKNSASFEREDGASWSGGDELEGEARRGGAARHAG